MGKTAMTHVRMTPAVKQEAESILKKLGLSISAAQELFYRQIIATKGIPFDLRIPDKKTVQAMEDALQGKGRKYSSVKEMFKDLDC